MIRIITAMAFCLIFHFERVDAACPAGCPGDVELGTNYIETYYASYTTKIYVGIFATRVAYQAARLEVDNLSWYSPYQLWKSIKYGLSVAGTYEGTQMVWGLVRTVVDTDEDCIIDCLDQCPSTLPERIDDVNAQGCAECNLKLSLMGKARLGQGESAVVAANQDQGLAWTVEVIKGDDVHLATSVPAGYDGRELPITVAGNSGPGVIRVTVSDSLADIQPCTRSLEIEVVGCRCTEQSCSTFDAGSIHGGFNLGRLLNGESAGRIALDAETMTPEIATPSALKIVSPSPEVKAVYDGPALRQVLTPEYLFDIVTTDPYQYTVAVYLSSAAADPVDGVYGILPGMEPSATWIVKNPDASLDVYNRLSIRKYQAEALLQSHEFDWDSITSTWTVDKGDGLQIKSVQKIPTQDGEVETEIVRNSDSDISTVIRTTVALIEGRRRTVEKVIDPDGAALTTTMAYHECPECSTGSCGRLKLQTEADGSWARYTYDSLGRILSKTVSWKDLTSLAAVDDARTVYYDYSTQDPQDAGLFIHDALPRLVTEKAEGVTVRKTYYSYRIDASGEITAIVEECTDPAALFGDVNNLRTTTVTYPFDAEAASSFKVKHRENPDKTLESHVYEYGVYTPGADASLPGVFVAGKGPWHCETITHGTQNHPGGLAFNSTRTRTVTDPFGRTVLEETLVCTGSDYERISWTVYLLDDQGRVTDRYASDGTHAETVWNCCGKESETDKVGILTAYTNDPLQRVVTETREAGSGGISIVYTYDASGRVLAEAESASGLSRSKNRSYDLAGRPTLISDETGLVTLYQYSSDGRTTTIIRPGGATEITGHYLDGRIRSITGTGVVPRYYTYGVDPDGSQWTRVNTGTATGTFFEKESTDMVGRVICIEKSGYLGNETTSNHYNAKGQLDRTRNPGIADTLYEYNELGNLTRTGLDRDGNGTLDPASMDRITYNETRFMLLDGHWWQETAQGVFNRNNEDDQTPVQTRRTRLTGLGPDGLTGMVMTTDVFGSVSTVRTSIDRTVRREIITTDVPDSSINEKTIMEYGLVTSFTDRTGKTMTYGYDTLGRRTSVTDPRCGTTKQIW
ncbi:MAG: hypothetical protein V1793_13635, partial [Pseudomonadota bacterium]